MSTEILVVEVVAAIMLAGVLVAGVMAGYRRWRQYRARRQIVRSFASASAALMRDVLVPDGSGGQLHVDFLLLTGRGFLVIDYRDVEGVVFGGEHMREWAVMNGNARSTFPNPLDALYDRVAAVRSLAGETPVEGRIVFTDQAKFPKGRPPRVMRLDLLEQEYPPPPSGTAHPGERYRQAWNDLAAQTEPSPLAR
jgi:hypothetical protein